MDTPTPTQKRMTDEVLTRLYKDATNPHLDYQDEAVRHIRVETGRARASESRLCDAVRMAVERLSDIEEDEGIASNHTIAFLLRALAEAES
jgi:hypothetical protein